MSDTVTDSLKLGTEATVMAIREYLMSYFKDGYTCYISERTNVTLHGNVHFDPERRTRNFERQVANLQVPRLLKIGNNTIMELQKKPDIIKMYNRTFNRSDEMKAIREGVDNFLNKFLKGVTVTNLQKGSIVSSEDIRLISDNSPDKLVRQVAQPIIEPLPEGFDIYNSRSVVLDRLFSAVDIATEDMAWTDIN